MQATELDLPEANENSIAIGLSCPDCETIRFYKIDNALNLIINRNISGISISAMCEHCSRRFIATLQWISKNNGWSYRKPPTATNVEIVSDENGLRLSNNANA